MSACHLFLQPIRSIADHRSKIFAVKVNLQNVIISSNGKQKYIAIDEEFYSAGVSCKRAVNSF